MSHFRLARLCLLLAAVGLNTAPALMTSAHAQKADAPAAANTVRPELFKLIDSAQIQQLIASKNFPELKNRIAQAEAIPNKTPYENYIVNRTKLNYGAASGDNAVLIAAVEAVNVSGFEPKETQAKFTLAVADIHYKAENYPAAVEQIKRYEALGGDMAAARPVLLRALYLSKDYAGAVPLLQQTVDEAEKAGKAPAEADLKLLRSAAYEAKNTAVLNTAVEKLATYYPNDEYWNELIRVGLVKKPGFNQDNYMLMLRLEFAALKVMREEDYVDFAETALREAFPTEAKTVMDAGYAAGVLGKGANAKAHNTLRDRVNKQAADDAKNIGSTEASAAKAKTGAGLVNLGWAYSTMGQHDKAIGFIQQGIAKGGLKAPDEAKLRLGIAQYKAGRKDEAAQTLATVKASGGYGDSARLWELLIKQPAGAGAQAAAAAQ